MHLYLVAECQTKLIFLSEVESMVKKFVIGKEYQGVFLKPKFGDASGVRGAARLGRNSAK
jgi:fructokinase